MVIDLFMAGAGTDAAGASFMYPVMEGTLLSGAAAFLRHASSVEEEKKRLSCIVEKEVFTGAYSTGTAVAQQWHSSMAQEEQHSSG